MTYRWLAPSPRPLAVGLARELGVRRVTAELLLNRGLTDAAAAARFLSPRLSDLKDPFLIPGMREACQRISAALTAGERITLFGDYDVDGVTSLAFFKIVLGKLGGAASCFIPNRLVHGYGLSESAAKQMYLEHTPQLVISLDCGTNSIGSISWLKEQGAETIVVDHHELQGEPPPAVAVVNPKADPTAEQTPYCTAGLVFKVAHALLIETGRRDIDLRALLDLVAVGTVADIVPLSGENRILTAHGLRRLAESQNLGLRTLVAVSGIRGQPTTTDIGYRIAPRINAAGRLAEANLSLELLLTQDVSFANHAATELDCRNRERQQIEDEMFQQALQDVLSTWSSDQTHAIVVARHDWHPGVVGIVASRLQRRFWRPSFVVALGDDGLGKGSGRSVEGVHIVRALAAAAKHLEQFGGHEMAAGLSVREKNLPALRLALNDYTSEYLRGEQRLPPLRLEAELDVADLVPDFYYELQKLQPFGQANPEPLFLIRDLRPAREPRLVGRCHTRMVLERDGLTFNAVAFGTAPSELPRPPWDIAGCLQLNDYFEQERVELRVVAVRTAV